jgi:hypothetical protein
MPPPLRPAQWLLHAHFIMLPLLAALVLEGQAEDRAPGGFNPANAAVLLQYHWFWLVVALGLGLWTGWHTAIARPNYQPPEQP